MSLYEVTVIGRQDLSQAQATTLADEIGAIVETNGGSISKKEYWGLRAFSYRIRKNRKGHYLYQEIEGNAATIDELDRLLKLHENVIRHLIVRVDAFIDGPTVMLTARPEREGRDGRPERGGDRFGGDRGAPRRGRDEGYRPRRGPGDEDVEDVAAGV